MGTKANPSKFDCYANAEPDEPMFILLARDPDAPTLVWLWSVLREIRGESKEVTDEARECVCQMIAYAAKRGKQINGIGESVLAGVMELIRGANYGVNMEVARNVPTTLESMRLFLAKTAFESEAKPIGGQT